VDAVTRVRVPAEPRRPVPVVAGATGLSAHELGPQVEHEPVLVALGLQALIRLLALVKLREKCAIALAQPSAGARAARVNLALRA
jgi:hypothetical protein